jgi:hypothetical protein
MNIKTKAISMVLVAVLTMVACTPAQVSTATSMLQGIVSMASAVIPILAPLVGVNPVLAAQIANWIAAVSGGVSSATKITQSTEPNLQKAADISTAFANTAMTITDLPPEIAPIINSVAGAVNAFVTEYGQPTQLKARYGEALKMKLTLTSGDKSALNNINSQANAVTAAAQAIVQQVQSGVAAKAN